MIARIYRSKSIASFLIVLMVFFICNSAYPQAGVSNEKKADKALTEGLDLYKAGQYVKAVERFSQVVALSKDDTKLSDAYFYLSLCNYFMGETDGAEEWAVKSLMIDPSREASDIYPAGYVDLFKKAKRTAGIELDKKRREEARAAEAEQPEPARVTQPEAPPAVVARSREKESGGGHGGLYLLIGVLVVGGAAAAYFLLKGKKSGGTEATTGSIQVSSTPTGAEVYLDGTDKGAAPLTISNVSVGSHTVKLTKEGYRDYTETVNVSGGQTSTVNATLTKHTITVNKPAAGAFWKKGTSVEIDWTTDTSAAVGGFFALSAGGAAGLASPTRWGLLNAQPGAVRGVRGRTEDAIALSARRGSSSEFPGPTGESRDVPTSRDIGPRGLKSPRLGSLAQLAGTAGRPAPGTSALPGSQEGPPQVRALIVTNVKIELYKGGSQVETIASSTSNDGSFTWTVPDSLSNGKDYKVRVSCADDTSVYGQSGAFEISAGYGKIFVKSTPSGATIFLDGANAGYKTPHTLNSVAVGTHTVKVTKTGYDTEEQTVTVTANKTVNVTFTLSGYGSIKVTSTPGSAEVYLDGSDTNKKTTCTLTRVVEGSHVVKVEKTGYETQEKTVTVKAGKTTNVDFTLKGIGKIHVTSNPTAATVYLDGDDTGEVTECTLDDVAAGDHTVKVEKDGYETQEKTVTVHANATANVNFTLAKSTITIDKPDWWSIWGKGKDVEIKWTTGSSAAGLNGLRTERELRGLIPALQNPLRNGEAARLAARTGRQSVQTGPPRVLGETQPFIARPGVKIDASVKSPGGPAGQVVAPAIANVKIELYKGGTAVKTIIDSTANDGSYTWTVDDTLEDGVDYQVVVSDAGGSGASGQSLTFALTDVTYEYQTYWGSYGSGNGRFIDPYGICVDKVPYVYVADTHNHRVQKFSSSGSYIKQWGSYGTLDGQFENPPGIAADINQVIFVSDWNNSRIQSFDQYGNYKTKWGSAGAGNGQFNGPYHVAVDPQGWVYVCDYYNSRVQKFWQTGLYTRQWGSYGAGNGQFNRPIGIAVDSSFDVYVADSNNNRIQVFDRYGTYLSQFGTSGTGDGQLKTPFGVAVDKSGFIYVVDYGNNRVQKFSPRGLYCCQWGTAGAGFGQFNGPMGIAVDLNGYVYVTEYTNDRVQKFR